MAESQEQTLTRLCGKIAPPNAQAARQARARWAAVAHPLGSLGLLEDAICRIAALTGNAEVRLDRRCVVVCCADNGVVAQGVSQSGPEVTATVADCLARGSSSVCTLAKHAGCRVLPVDLGILNYPGRPGVLDRRVANGTGDISCGPAMTREQAAQAVLTGIDLARALAGEKEQILCTGEMGIGNTTTASALACALTGRRPEEMTGRGAGLSDAALARKKAIVARALEVNRPTAADPLGALAAVGGFDIAAMAGLFLGGALWRVPVVMDGFISAVAALTALRLAPACSCALLASHVSAEPAGALLLRELGQKPLLCAEMRLGEGTGAVAALPLLDLALALYGGSTFADYNMEAYKPQ